MSKRDYGTATFEEIQEAFKVTTEIAEKIRALPNPATQNMVKQMVALIVIPVRPTPNLAQTEE